MCKHGRERSKCKECGGNGICQHGRQRSRCKKCGGAGAAYICKPVHGSATPVQRWTFIFENRRTFLVLSFCETELKMVCDRFLLYSWFRNHLDIANVFFDNNCKCFLISPNYLLRNTSKSTQNERCNQRVWSNPTIKNSPRGKRTSSVSSASFLAF